MVVTRSFRAVVACCGLASAGRPAWTRSCKSTETADEVLRGVDLTGKVIIYTGADGNIASESVVALARANATLIMACHTPSKCETAKQKVLERSGTTAPVETEQIDLSLQANIADFATRVMAKHPKIDVVINSAGTYGAFMTHDNLIGAMEINVLGPALLSHLLLPALRGHGRVVNVAAAAYAPPYLTENTTVADLSAITTSLDPMLNATGGYYGLSKFLMVHHAIELAEREPTVTAVSLAPGVAIDLPDVPNWLKHAIIHFPYPKPVLDLLPADFSHFVRACTTNEVGLASCPETQAQGAAVIVAAAAWPEVDAYSGSYFDFDSKALPADAPHEYGPWTQADPTCVPRQPDPMDAALRAAWYDEMLRLMTSGAEPAHAEAPATREALV